MAQHNSIGLVDCNNFYASCERVFRPDLRGKPVIVLSNNDGCVIARSAEAKVLGIQMGQPYFECEKMVKNHQVHVFSSNFALYGDFSKRVMAILEESALNVEVYSIDEAFIDLSQIPFEEIQDYASGLRSKILQWTGIPVSIGIGPTKTLAKVANRMAKRYAQFQGVFDITDHPHLDEILESMDVSEIWGIGRKLSKFLYQYGITNALQLKNARDDWVKKNMAITGLRTVLELRSIPKIGFQEIRDHQQSIMTSRSFRHPVTTFCALFEAVATFTARAAEKLRHQRSLASYLLVYVSTGHYQKGVAYGNRCGKELPSPSCFTPDLIAVARHCLKNIFQSGYGYKKAGVMLTGILPKRQEQLDLFTSPECRERRENLMFLIDRTNFRLGSETLKYGAAGIAPDWRSRQEKRSKNYTTQWSDLLEIHLGSKKPRK